MSYRTIAEIAALIERFENCTVNAAEWTHAAHLTAAAWYVLHHDLPEAINKMRAGILRLNEAHGTPNTETRGYHETLTVFWVRRAADFFGAVKDENLSIETINEFIARHADSRLPLGFYSAEVLFSPAARARFVAPDLPQN